MPPVGFEPKISAGERTKTYALDRAATGTGSSNTNNNNNDNKLWKFSLKRNQLSK